MESPNNAEFPQDVIAVRQRLFSLQKQLKIREDYFILVRWDLRRLVEKTHMFKWTDRSVVEEIEDFQELVDVLLIDNSQFQNSLTACETMLKRQESRIEEMEDVIGRCEEKTIECIREL
uniref:Uncharacterized protein n=1 Tax=Brassica oleracea var. oleracea TaxID=109376 RepID=A0A0D2ZXR9_BRAOL